MPRLVASSLPAPAGASRPVTMISGSKGSVSQGFGGAGPATPSEPKLVSV